MATAGPSTPGTIATSSTSGYSYNWTNPDNSKTSNNSYATAGPIVDSDGSYFLIATNFGFALPASTINGITVTVERKSSRNTSTNYLTDSSVQIIKGGTAGGTDYADSATHWPTTDGVKTYGGAADKWGLTWLYTDINASTFGVQISCVCSAVTATSLASVDAFTITIDYTETATGTPKQISLAPHLIRFGREDGNQLIRL
jgi:hypothetical protein